MSSSGAWTGPFTIRPGTGAAWTSNASVSLAASSSGTLYMLRTDANGQLDFLYRATDSSWYASTTYDLPADPDLRTDRKPGLGWMWDYPNQPQGAGSWFIAYLRPAPNDPQPRLARFRNGGDIYPKLVKAPMCHVDQRADAANVDLGIDVTWGTGDDNLHGMYVFNDGGDGDKDKVVVYPWIDGVLHEALQDTNDFELMGEGGICRDFATLLGAPCGPQVGGQPLTFLPEITCQYEGGP